MTVRVEVQPELFAWARRRSRTQAEDLSKRFPKLEEWEAGAARPTFKQLEAFAQATHTPLGFLLLPAPPEERVPLPDFRTVGGVALDQPSANLLDTLFQCEQRQEWYRDYLRGMKEAPPSFVGSLSLQSPIVDAGSTMRDALGFTVESRGSSWAEAFKNLSEAAEDLGVLVMVNGVVGSNTHRKLDPNEFRGFAMVDELAPLVFINGADTQAGRIFSLAHELAHVWLGQSALSNVEVGDVQGNATERWCNEVAAEFLMPLSMVEGLFDPGAALTDELQRLARTFRVSTLVAIRRVHDAGFLADDVYWSAYAEERERVLKLVGEGVSTGGNFYNTQPVRVSKRFARAVITSALEGQTLYRDALSMLGIKKLSTFKEMSHRLEVA